MTIDPKSVIARCAVTVVVALAMTGCSSWSWFGGGKSDSARTATSLARASSRDQIVDEVSRCATSNPFSLTGERIRWYGACKDGKLHGQGTLIWYRGAEEIERNVGHFAQGEFDGQVITTYPTGHGVFGNYVGGERHGVFIVTDFRARYVRATYAHGTITAQRNLNPSEIDAWNRQRIRQSNPPAPRHAKKSTRVISTVRGLGSSPTQSLMPSPTQQPARRPINRSISPMPNRVSASGSPQFRPLVPRIDGRTGPGRQDWMTVEQFHGIAAGSVVSPSKYPPGRRVDDRQWLRIEDFHSLTPATPASRPRSDARSFRDSLSPRLPAGPMSVGWLTASKFHEAQRMITVPVRATGRDVVVGFASDRADISATRRIDDFKQVGNPVAVAPRSWPGNEYIVRADSIFAAGYRSEREGRIEDARRYYEEVLLRYASAPSARLANVRLSNFDLAGYATAAQRPGRFTPTASQEDRGVVSVNRPVPSQGVSGASGPRPPRLQAGASDVSRKVCTRKGLYENESRWCGRVIADNSSYYNVEVHDVYVRGFGTIGLNRSTCTGNAFLTWLSRGTRVRVPKACMILS